MHGVTAGTEMQHLSPAQDDDADDHGEDHHQEQDDQDDARNAALNSITWNLTS